VNTAGRYDETQVLARTKIGLVVMITSLSGLAPAFVVLAVQGASTRDWIILTLVGVFVMSLAWLIRIRIRVEPGLLKVRFWWLPSLRVDPADLEGLEVVSFDPLGDFGGWGLKLTKRHGRAYCIAGPQGVRFRVGERRYVVASKDAPGLALALAEAGAPAPESLKAVSVKETPLYERTGYESERGSDDEG